MTLGSSTLSVAEFHGPYGPYNVSELVLQRVWLTGAFEASGLVDQWGRSIVVESPGRWNRLEGPDFLDASLVIDGANVRGDVEVHFAQSDWKAHGHDTDPRYNNVVLHIIYHPLGKRERPVVTQSGNAVPAVALLPLLWYSLEEYASEDSIVATAGVDLSPEVESLLPLPVPERRARLVAAARKRWSLKRHFALQRLERLGWSGACHQTAMEILGYAKNRIPMLMAAERFPLFSLLDGSVEADALWEAGAGRWRLSGSRPANHPHLRLQQYLDWIEARPCWPELLRELGSAFVARCGALGEEEGAFGSGAVRRALGIADLAERIDGEVAGNVISGAKRNTLVCDGFLPLLAAVSDAGSDLFSLWFHWPEGNAPDACAVALRQIEIREARRFPASNGWIQGMLGLAPGGESARARVPDQ